MPKKLRQRNSDRITKNHNVTNRRATICHTPKRLAKTSFVRATVENGDCCIGAAVGKGVGFGLNEKAPICGDASRGFFKFKDWNNCLNCSSKKICSFLFKEF